jgi:hypothetical protein
MHNHTEQIREYYQQAAHCAERADAQMDPKVKQQFLLLRELWLLLASYCELEPTNRASPKRPSASGDARG